jgi:hypothetical protein
MKTDHDAPRVRCGTWINEDTGEITPLYLYTHEAIDGEIDQRVRLNKLTGCCDLESHRAARAKFHALLDVDAANLERKMQKDAAVPA